MGILPKDRGKNQKCLKPPASYVSIDVFCSQILGFDPLTFLEFVRLDPKNLKKLYLVNMSIEGENERWYQNCAKWFSSVG